MSATSPQTSHRRSVGGNIWLSRGPEVSDYLAKLPARDLVYEVMPSEEAVGRAMLAEIIDAEATKSGPMVMVLVGGRGGQARVAWYSRSSTPTPRLRNASVNQRLLTTRIADDAETRQTQFDQNPGLWLRVHPNVRSLILQDVLEN